MDRHELYKAILRGATGIDLPQAPVFAAHEEQQAEEVLRAVERDIGEAAKGDYYTCCRLRFAMVIQLALRYLPPGASILDVGNAPGYLALALHKCGFKVAGINLSDAWLDAYPSKDVATLFNPKSCDIEREMTPYLDQSFDAIVFTEVLEHIAIKHPRKLGAGDAQARPRTSPLARYLIAAPGSIWQVVPTASQGQARPPGVIRERPVIPS